MTDGWRRAAPMLIPTLAAIATAVLFVALGGLSAELRKDELFYWPAAVHFSHHWLPTLQDFRTSPVPGTPLPFLIFGAIEHATGRGLVLGRLLNAIIAIGTVAAISGGLRRVWQPRSLAACGLLACPYFLGVSVYLYTDPLPIACVAFGILAHVHRRYAASGLCMALAIACRQYMIAFPVAIAIWEAWTAARSAGWRAVLAAAKSWAPHALATLTLLGWFWVFGGVAPAGAAERFGMTTADPSRVLARNSLYSLTCVGAYFVVVEMALFRTRIAVRELLSPRVAACAALLAVAFFIFPPLENSVHEFAAMGYLDKAARLILGDIPRMVVFWLLAVLAVARFGRSGLALFLVVLNALVMMKAHIGWDKYALPLLAALWMLKSREALDRQPGPSAEPLGEPHP